MTPRCRACGRLLHTEASRAAGIGPVCGKPAQKHTAPRPATPDNIHPGQLEVPLAIQSALTWSL
ncbi:DUF6011 domain-containing protein [Streptomyces sp. NPDC005776]|uniref:DUF6011 domain-containing protein n=1 Tax=Streptomyces sp. NPDC005776 TaxID=3154676 RepID=UPI0033F18C7D